MCPRNNGSELQNPGLQKRTILLVDDDAMFRTAFQKILERLGYNVVIAINGKVARELLDFQIFDLVISDIRMPELDGIELTQLIKGSARPVPVILVTGFSEIVETKEAFELGADEFLPKPINQAELIGAIDRCLVRREVASQSMTQDAVYCRLGVDDFVSGRQILFNIFVQLSEGKYVKIAHQGEDLSVERIRAYRSKGIRHLYLRRQDFRTYVGFGLTPSKGADTKPPVSQAQKVDILQRTAMVLLELVKQEGLSAESYESAVTFVQTTVDILSDDPDIFSLLEALCAHTDYLYAHSVGVSLYSVMLAQSVAWHLPTNKFKVAVGGLLHDVGEKEIASDILSLPRKDWSLSDLRLYESHPTRSVEILGGIHSLPADVIQIAKEHHEGCLGQGYPSRIRRSAIHPMARIISVADEFCERTMSNPNSSGATPHDALRDMTLYCADRLDQQFFEALLRLFDYERKPPNSKPERGRQSTPSRVR